MMTLDIMSFYNIEGMTAATWMNNAITIAKIIGNLSAAWFLVKLGPKKAFTFASALIVAGATGVNYPWSVIPAAAPWLEPSADWHSLTVVLRLANR